MAAVKGTGGKKHGSGQRNDCAWPDHDLGIHLHVPHPGLELSLPIEPLVQLQIRLRLLFLYSIQIALQRLVRNNLLPGENILPRPVEVPVYQLRLGVEVRCRIELLQ